MSEPIVIISTLKLKEGKVDEYKQFTRETTEWLQMNRPRTIAILEYFNDDNTELSIVMIFSDEDAMQTHMQGLGELPTKSFEYLEPINIQIYGKPNKATMEMMKMIAGSGVTINIKPHSIGGYARLKLDE